MISASRFPMLQPGPGSRAISGRTSRCRSDSWDSPAPAGARSSFEASCATNLGGGSAADADIGAVPVRTVLTAIMGSLRPAASGPPGHCQGGEPPGVPGLFHQHAPGDGSLPADVVRQADGCLGRGRSEGQAVRTVVPGRDCGRDGLSKPPGPSKAPTPRGFTGTGRAAFPAAFSTGTFCASSRPAVR